MASARRILGLGHPRGGTRYASRLLVTAGCRALHEANGRDGSVSCWLTVNDWWHPHMHSNGLRSDYPEAVILHIVRNPLDSITSLAKFKHMLFWSWQRFHTGLDYQPESMEFYAKFWLKWNEIIESQNPFARMAVERPAESWSKISDVLGIGEMPTVERDPSWVTKDKSSIAWGDLGETALAVQKKAAEYGYEV